jgi:hypothetical protein
MLKKSIKTKKEDIVAYWFSRVDESGLSVDASEAHERCWRCGCEKRLERCHIIPESLGGKDEPSNLVLLCKRCHLDNPNIKHPEIMWDWIRAYGVPIYDTFWNILGMREYEFIYNKTFVQELYDLGLDKEKEIYEIIESSMQELMEETSFHFGHPYLNVATIAGMYRITLQKLAKKFNKKILVKSTDTPRTPWWYCIGR